METTLLQYRECFTGFHEPNLNDTEHADDDEILAPFFKWKLKQDNQIRAIENQLHELRDTKE